MSITKQDVELAAKLAKMKVSDEEATIYEDQLKELFTWVDELSAVNTDGVKLTNVNLAAHIRPDEPISDSARAEQLRNTFTDQEADCAKVKKVL
ncbi:MAG: Asp-tRNA(Asn)/Glu-tRNA(Gln) amidotransferase subunit GatC [Elusimicrobiaceae bacterium]|nr:Asp-tRNA(Asn)/Glu-tRNA(Gln) amidotransferase subunit GatC [Elusimicrobiaceae bacterium]